MRDNYQVTLGWFCMIGGAGLVLMSAFAIPFATPVSLIGMGGGASLFVAGANTQARGNATSLTSCDVNAWSSPLLIGGLALVAAGFTSLTLSGGVSWPLSFTLITAGALMAIAGTIGLLNSCSENSKLSFKIR